jgi:osmoprotectant transport system permease protein
VSFLLAGGYDEAPNPWFSWGYVHSHGKQLLAAGEQHLFITLAAVALAMIIAFPLALVARRYRRLRGPLLGIGGILYTIPAISMISLLWPVFGLSPTTVVISLAIYALLVLLRNTMTGLDGVPEDVLDAARGRGYGDRRLLWKVELPLALPAIFAGIRLATVSTVGLVLIGSLVGYGGYGTLIVAGFQSNFYHAQIMTATVLTVILAIVLEGLLLLTQHVLTPWARSRTRFG